MKTKLSKVDIVEVSIDLKAMWFPIDYMRTYKAEDVNGQRYKIEAKERETFVKLLDGQLIFNKPVIFEPIKNGNHI